MDDFIKDDHPNLSGFVPDRECFICHVDESTQALGTTKHGKSICIDCQVPYKVGYEDGMDDYHHDHGKSIYDVH